MNQNQADCLISFGYNVGPRLLEWFLPMDARTIMLNAVVPPEKLPSGGLAATITKATSLYASASRDSSKVMDVASGASATVIAYDFSDIQDGWYKVKCGSKTGWVNSGYVQLSNASSLVPRSETIQTPMHSERICAVGAQPAERPIPGFFIVG